MRRAFLFVEAALAHELATPSRVCMTEDYFRASLVRGLANSKPELASRITTEDDALWGGSQCWKCAEQPGQGRPIQHDVAVVPDANDQGMACEVKWLKSANATSIARDIWKLALSRGTVAEGAAKRCYLLIGGEADPLSDTLRTLRKGHADLRWSNAGRKGGQPASRSISLRAFIGSKVGSEALKKQLSWGSNPTHVRRPADCWQTMMISRRGDPWVRTLDGTGWRAVLFELHHHGADDNAHLDPATFYSGLVFKC